MADESMRALPRSAGVSEPPLSTTAEHGGGQDESIGSLQPIAHLREVGNQSLEEGDTQKAKCLFEEALTLANVTGRNSLCNQICKDIDHCRVMQWMNDGREKLKEGDVKTAGDMFTSGLGLANTLVMQGVGLRRPEVIQELYHELDHCKALSLKEEGNSARKTNNYPTAIEKYTEALEKAEAADKKDLFLQLLINRSIVLSKQDNQRLALSDAFRSIDIAPSSFYRGYFRVAQVLKVQNNPKGALNALRDGLSRTTPPPEFQVDFVMEIISLAAQLDQLDFLSTCKIAAETWSLVFMKMAKKSLWIRMKQLFEESLANMDDCGRHVDVTDLLKHSSSGSCETKLWSQRLAIALLKRGSPYPMDKSVTFMKRALDFGIETGNFQLLKFIFKNHVMSVADRNRTDETGESLYRYLTRISTGLTNHTIALNLLDNHGIDVCPQQGEQDEVKKSKETVRVSTPKETPQSLRSKETAQAYMPKETSHVSKPSGEVQASSPKETAQAPRSRENAQAHKLKETAQASKTKKTTQASKLEETVQVSTPKEASQAAPPCNSQAKNGATLSKGTAGSRKSNKHDTVLQPAMAEGRHRGARPKKIKTTLCKKCNADDESANIANDKGSYMHECACKQWIGIVNEEGHPMKYHQRYKTRAQNSLLDVVKKRKEVPEGLTSLKAADYSFFVIGAGNVPDWKLVKQLITAYENQNGKESIVNLAKDIDVEMYLRRPGTQGTNFLRRILEAGGSAIKKSKGDKLPLETAIKNKHWSAIPLLIEFGADVDAFSLKEGDTPLHAALEVAMVKDKRGDFQVLQRLLDLHQSDQEKYQALNPSRQDKAGDTLFHVAAKTQDAYVGLKAVKFLFGKGVNPTLLNSDGKTALQCLTKKSDRRAHEIRVACQAFDDNYKTGTSKKKNKVQSLSRQVSRDAKKLMNQATERGLDKPESKAMGKQRVVVSREDIQIFLNDLGREELYYINDDNDDYDDDDKEEEEVQNDLTCGLNPDASTGLHQLHHSKQAIHNNTTTPSCSTSEVDSKTITGTEVGDAPSGIDSSSSHTARLCEEEYGDDQQRVTYQANGQQNSTVQEVPDESSSESESDEDEDLDTIDPGIFEDLQWDIECTSEVWNTLYKKNLDQKMRNRICQKIRMLGSGEFDNHRHLKKRLDLVPPDMQLYEAKITKGARLIWEIDIAFSSKLSHPSNIRLTEDQNQRTSSEASTCRPIYTEVIRLWGIVLKHDNIFRAVQNVVRSHSKGNECLLQKKLEGIKGNDNCRDKDGKRIPLTFTEVDGGLQPVKKFVPPASSKETEYHILKWYSFDYLVSSILNNKSEEIDFPFSVTEREYAVINIDQKPPCALLLLGRSGTGKTTCCLYRLWSKFVAYWKGTVEDCPLIPRFVKYDRKGSGIAQTASDGDEGGKLADDVTSSSEVEIDVMPKNQVPCDHLHQLFITKNPVLRNEISQNFSYLSHGCPEAQPHVAVEGEPLPHRLQSVHPCAYPLFVTSKQFLVLLDASLPGPYYFPRNEDGTLIQDVAGWGDDDGSLTFIPDLDNNDLELDDEEGAAAAAEHGRSYGPKREVTYELFAEELWPEMIKNEQDKVTCHPSLIWTEICSFIKGSIEALHSNNGRLDLDAYIELGKKRAPNFPGARDQVYRLFLTYAKLIKSRQRMIKNQEMFDEMDLIFNLYNRINKVSYPEWSIHEVYVDETQDFTQAELALLIRCCQDPNQMFLTGDTAQSIMRGIAFRFEDLKSLFHYVKQSNLARGKTNAVAVPRTVYQLIHNYRSHAGILHLATSLLDIIDRFFPASYDREGLEKDRGLFEGPKPVIIDCCNHSDLAMVLSGNKRETSQIEFGAHQAILVVNDEARDSLPEELSFGLVLTIYESKGLEFDDILIYNFFKDSQAKEEWRVVIQYLDEMIQEQMQASESEKDVKELITIDMEAFSARRRPRPLDFDAEKHKILNSELKHLYTAVTRARVNIWFFDEDEDARKPMFTYFQALELVRTVQAKGDSDEQRLTELLVKQSSKREWRSRGDELLRKSRYEVAAKCYKNAKRTRLYHLCLANQEALTAKRTDDKHVKRERYLAVSMEYLRCHEFLQAANCLYNAKEYKLAATLYANDEVRKYKDAAKIYRSLKSYDKACEMFELGKAYKEALHLYYDLKKYDKAIDVLRRYEKTVVEYQGDNETMAPCRAQDACRKCDLHELALKAAEQHKQRGNIEEMMQALEHLDHDVAIRFLTRYSFTSRVAEFKQKHGRNIEAAEIYNRLGDIDRAMECVEECSDDNNDQLFYGELKLEKARSLSKHKASKEAAKELLKSAQQIFKKHKNKMKEAECLLLLGMHNDDAAETPEKILHEAYQAFWNIDYSIAELECIYQAVKLFPERFTLRECGVAVIRCANIGLRLATMLKHRGTREQTIKDAETVKKCLRFYGLDSFGSDGYSALDIPSNARISHLIQEEESTCRERKISRNDAEKLIVKDILGEKVKLLWIHARRIATQNKTIATICPKYRLGFECQSSSDSGCPFKHTPHDPESFRILIQSSTLLMELDSIIAKAREEQGLQAEVELFRELLSASEGNTSSFDDLYQTLYPLDRQEPVLFGSPKVTDSFLEGFQKTLTKELLLWNASLKKDHFIAKDKFAKYWSAEMYFFLHAVYLLVGESGKVRKLLLDAEKDEKPPVYIGFVLQNEDKKTRALRLHIFRYILDMLSTLYDQRDPLFAIGNCNQYFYQVAKRGHEKMYPPFSHTMMIFEYKFALTCCMYVKHIGDNAFLPKSYLAHIAFFDRVYGGEQDFQTFSIVQNYKADGKAINRLQGGQWSFAKLFCGRKFHRFHMLRYAFGEGSQWLQTGEAERVFIFALVLLVNADRAMPNTWRNDRMSLEYMLMTDIASIRLDDTSCPKRLRDAVEATKTAKGLLDVANILTKILLSRGEEELMDCSWATFSRKRRNFCSVKLERYNLFPKSFYRFRPDDTEVASAKEVSVAEAHEDYPDERAERETADYAKRIRQQQEEHQVPAAVQGTIPLTIDDATIDVNLKIDDTMCSTCGVIFSKEIEEPLKDVEPARPEDVTSQPDDKPNVSLDTQVSVESIPDYKQQHITREVHELSEAHIRKQAECKEFLQYLKERVQPLQEEALSFKDETSATDSDASEVNINNLSRRLNVVIGNQREKRDWSDRNTLEQACQTMREALDVQTKGSALLQQQPEPLSAGSGAGGSVEGLPRLSEGEDALDADRDVVKEPVNVTAMLLRSKNRKT